MANGRGVCGPAQFHSGSGPDDGGGGGGDGGGAVGDGVGGGANGGGGEGEGGSDGDDALQATAAHVVTHVSNTEAYISLLPIKNKRREKCMCLDSALKIILTRLVMRRGRRRIVHVCERGIGLGCTT